MLAFLLINVCKRIKKEYLFIGLLYKGKNTDYLQIPPNKVINQKNYSKKHYSHSIEKETCID